MEIIVILPFQVACSQFLSIAKESRSSNLSEVFCMRVSQMQASAKMLSK
jgi:hypothetical protein